MVSETCDSAARSQHDAHLSTMARTLTVEVKEYIDFLWTLFLRITKLQTDVAPAPTPEAQGPPSTMELPATQVNRAIPRAIVIAESVVALHEPPPPSREDVSMSTQKILDTSTHEEQLKSRWTPSVIPRAHVQRNVERRHHSEAEMEETDKAIVEKTKAHDASMSMPNKVVNDEESSRQEMICEQTPREVDGAMSDDEGRVGDVSEGDVSMNGDENEVESNVSSDADTTDEEMTLNVIPRQLVLDAAFQARVDLLEDGNIAFSRRVYRSLAEVEPAGTEDNDIPWTPAMQSELEDIGDTLSVSGVGITGPRKNRHRKRLIKTKLPNSFMNVADRNLRFDQQGFAKQFLQVKQLFTSANVSIVSSTASTIEGLDNDCFESRTSAVSPAMTSSRFRSTTAPSTSATSAVCFSARSRNEDLHGPLAALREPSTRRRPSTSEGRVSVNWAPISSMLIHGHAINDHRAGENDSVNNDQNEMDALLETRKTSMAAGDGLAVSTMMKPGQRPPIVIGQRLAPMARCRSLLSLRSIVAAAGCCRRLGQVDMDALLSIIPLITAHTSSSKNGENLSDTARLHLERRTQLHNARLGIDGLPYHVMCYSFYIEWYRKWVAEHQPEYQQIGEDPWASTSHKPDLKRLGPAASTAEVLLLEAPDENQIDSDAMANAGECDDGSPDTVSKEKKQSDARKEGMFKERSIKIPCGNVGAKPKESRLWAIRCGRKTSSPVVPSDCVLAPGYFFSPFIKGTESVCIANQVVEGVESKPTVSQLLPPIRQRRHQIKRFFTPNRRKLSEIGRCTKLDPSADVAYMASFRLPPILRKTKIHKKLIQNRRGRRCSSSLL